MANGGSKPVVGPVQQMGAAAPLMISNAMFRHVREEGDSKRCVLGDASMAHARFACPAFLTAALSQRVRSTASGVLKKPRKPPDPLRPAGTSASTCRSATGSGLKGTMAEPGTVPEHRRGRATDSLPLDHGSTYENPAFDSLSPQMAGKAGGPAASRGHVNAEAQQQQEQQGVEEVVRRQGSGVFAGLRGRLFRSVEQEVDGGGVQRRADSSASLPRPAPPIAAAPAPAADGAKKKPLRSRFSAAVPGDVPDVSSVEGLRGLSVGSNTLGSQNPVIPSPNSGSKVGPPAALSRPHCLASPGPHPSAPLRRPTRGP